MKNLWIFFWILPLVFSFGCGDWSMESESKKQPPVISDTWPPLGGENVSVDSVIRVTFNKKVNPDSITLNRDLSPAYLPRTSSFSCEGSVQLSADGFNSCVGLSDLSTDDNLTFQMTLDSTLDYNMTYQLMLGADIEDIDGEPIFEEEYISNFTTESDGTPPLPGNEGTITVGNVSGSSLTLTWNAASDLSEPLLYRVFKSNSSNIGSPYTAENLGTMIQDWSADLSSDVSDLNFGATYYFNVLVKDSYGNQAAYDMTSATTLFAIPQASLFAEIGADDALISLEGLEDDFIYYRSSEATCDFSDYVSCADSYMEFVSSEDPLLTDNYITVNTEAYIQLESGERKTNFSLPSTRFSGRNDHQALVFNGKMYLIGGMDNLKYYNHYNNDVWSSVDGVFWSRDVSSSEFESGISVPRDASGRFGISVPETGEGFHPRKGHQVVLFNDHMYLIGGKIGYNEGSRADASDVWRSADGINWTQLTLDAGFPATSMHQVAAFNDKLYLISDSIWDSTDGVNWNEIVSSAPYPSRRHHQAVVFNDKIYLIGGESKGYLNDVWDSTDGVNWNEVVSNAPFSARRNHQAVVFDDKLYLIAGESEERLLNDVWYSSDGVNWSLLTDNADFPLRRHHQVLAFGDQLYLIGGSLNNDVWASPDGLQWTRASKDSKFSPRKQHQMTAFDGRLFVVAGAGSGYPCANINNADVWSSTDGYQWDILQANAPFSTRRAHHMAELNGKLYLVAGNGKGTGCAGIELKNDVWESIDGITWTEATDDSPFSARFDHQLVSFNGKLYLIGGKDDNGSKSDVWDSADGLNWTEATSDAAFSNRNGHKIAVFDNKMYLIGGSYKNDVWDSTDGVNWTEATSDAPFSGRLHHQVAAFNGKLYVIGGYDGSSLNDIWSSEDGVSWTLETDGAAFQKLFFARQTLNFIASGFGH